MSMRDMFSPQEERESGPSKAVVVDGEQEEEEEESGSVRVGRRITIAPPVGSSGGSAAQMVAGGFPQRGGDLQKRDKVPLGVGKSLGAWINLTRREPNQVKEGHVPRRIPMKEVKQHRTREDAWTVLKGRVYYLTPYMDYHPGGEQKLMMGAGRDCTKLFDKYHSWVNDEMLLQSCFLGWLDEEETS